MASPLPHMRSHMVAIATMMYLKRNLSRTKLSSVFAKLCSQDIKVHMKVLQPMQDTEV